MVSILVGVFGEVGFAGGGEFVVPVGAEVGGEGAAEELVEADAEAAAVLLGAAADFPPMVVYGGKGRVFGQAHGVEGARGGFAETAGLSFVTCFLDGAETHAAGGVAGVDAVASVDNLGDEVAVGVEIACPGLGYALAGTREQVVFDGGEDGVEGVAFFLGQGRARVAVDAALPEALREVAAEKLFGEVEGDEGVLYL